MKKSLLLLALITYLIPVSAQEFDEDYVTEITWGVNKNTNSGLIGGLVFKLARQKAENVYTVYGLEIQNVKHPKEKRYPSASGTFFVFGKENFLYSIRGNYGREHVLFKKAPQQGVQISAIVAGGPTLGIIAPYYVLIGGNYVPYDSELHRNYNLNSFQGSGKLLQGVGDSNFTLGLNAKAAVSFEFGAFRNNVAGVELGTMLEAFTKEIPIIPTQDNRAIFPSLFFTLYWGTRR